MKIIDRGEDFDLTFQMKNNFSGVVDLTSASITANFKESKNSSSTAFQRRNTAAGGSDTELEIIDTDEGLGVIHIVASNTTSLTKRDYYYEIIAVIGIATYKIADFIRIKQNTGAASVIPTYGTTAQRPTLTTADVGFEYYDTTLDSPIWWNGSEWTP